MAGSTITLEASIAALAGTATPMGTISFKDGATTLATATLSDSGATATASATSTTARAST